MTRKKKLEAQVDMIHELIAGVEPMPNLNDKRAVVAYFERAPDLAENSLKEYVARLCEGYLKGLLK